MAAVGVELNMTLKFYASVAKWLKLKVRKLWGLIPTFTEVTGKNLVGRRGMGGGLLRFPILNTVNLVSLTKSQSRISAISKKLNFNWISFSLG